MKWLKDDCEENFGQREAANVREQQTPSGILEGIVKDTELAAHLLDSDSLPKLNQLHERQIIMSQSANSVALSVGESSPSTQAPLKDAPPTAPYVQPAHQPTPAMTLQPAHGQPQSQSLLQQPTQGLNDDTTKPSTTSVQG